MQYAPLWVNIYEKQTPCLQVIDCPTDLLFTDFCLMQRSLLQGYYVITYYHVENSDIGTVNSFKYLLIFIMLMIVYCLLTVQFTSLTAYYCKKWQRYTFLYINF